LVHWIWSGINPMARLGSMVAALKAGVQAAANTDARSNLLSMEASLYFGRTIAGQARAFHLAAA
jgi:hypothetical protein